MTERRPGQAPDLDLTRHHFWQEHGDIAAIGAWMGRPSPSPVLVLVTSNLATLRNGGSAPFVIPLNNAHFWSPDPDVGDPGHAVRNAIVAAHCLGFDHHNQMTLMRITSVVHSHLDDLLRMPPLPPGWGSSGHVAADAVLTTESGREIHAEIMDDV